MCVRQRQYGSLERNQVLVTKTNHVIMPPAALDNVQLLLRLLLTIEIRRRLHVLTVGH